MPDIEGVPYEATGGKVDQATAQALAARHREAASAGAGAASAAIAPVQSQVSALSSRVDSQDAKTLADAKAYTDSKVTGLATTAAMQAGDALTLSSAKTYTDQQLADFDSFVGVPIFETLAEAEAWEAANPGKRALTLEPSTPDTTAPTLGTMSVVADGTSATASVAGASDDRGAVEYAFRLGSGAWSAWQADPSFKFTSLTVSTDYTGTHRVRDRAGNEVEGYPVPFRTLAADQWGTAASDNFDAGSGSIHGRTLPGTQLTWERLVQADGSDPVDNLGGGVLIPQIVGGRAAATVATRASAVTTLFRSGRAWSSSKSTWSSGLAEGDLPGLGAVTAVPAASLNRVEMSMTQFPGSGSYWNNVAIIFGGVGPGEHAALRYYMSGGNPFWTLAYIGPNNASFRLPLKGHTGATIAGKMVYDAPSTVTATLTGDKIIVAQNGETRLDLKLPQAGQELPTLVGNDGTVAKVPTGVRYDGPYFGFAFDTTNSEAYVDNFSIRWE